MKHVFVLNPVAGSGDMIEPLKEKIKAACEKHGAEYEIYETKSRGDAEAFARKRADLTSEKTRFYACGGDGTLCEIVNGVIGNINAEIGLLPIGTGNDFVRNFERPDDFLDIEKQIAGEPAATDVIKYNDRYCVNVLNAGFDCNVVETMESLRENKLVPGKMKYVAGVAVNFFKKFGTGMKIIADGEDISGEKMLCAVANGGFYGGGFHSAPRSRLDDGLFDLCVVKKVSRAKFLSLVGPYKEGKHLEKKGAEDCITYKQCKNLCIEFEKERPVCIDGEIERMKRVDAQIVHKAIMFSVPAASQSTEDKKPVAAEISK